MARFVALCRLCARPPALAPLVRWKFNPWCAGNSAVAQAGDVGLWCLTSAPTTSRCFAAQALAHSAHATTVKIGPGCGSVTRPAWRCVLLRRARWTTDRWLRGGLAVHLHPAFWKRVVACFLGGRPANNRLALPLCFAARSLRRQVCFACARTDLVSPRYFAACRLAPNKR